MKILYIEDDAVTAALLKAKLVEDGNVVDHVTEGREGLALAARESYDVAIIDRMLPEIDGLAIVKAMRGAGVRTPVLFLTARSGLDDRVEGLEGGGDDYLVKPFDFPELIARLHALTRRPPLGSGHDTVLRAGDLEMDLIKRVVTRSGQRIELQAQEFKLLEYLMRNAGRIVTRAMLLENVWEFPSDPKTTVVETHISRLRRKVDRDFGEELLETVRGAGYRLRTPSTPRSG
ncbi:MAG: response regulator transcription factor [Deltaproteobacteria bacterium]|nr:MAG: response regulator transcription factor [Deltaproteobacteria bacterium]